MTKHLPYAVAIWVLLVGLWGAIRSRNLVHLVVCMSVIQSSTYVLLLTIGYRSNAAAPIFVDIPANTPAVDPVVQALMLTDIVVEVTVVALLLALVVQAYKRTGKLDPNQLSLLRE